MQETRGGLRGYVVCALPRSGSSYFCQLLQSTGNLGFPIEYFNTVGRRRDVPDYPTAPAAQIKEVLRSGTPNGVYGFKLMPAQVDLLRRYQWADCFSGLKYVQITRNDLLGQAISLARAVHSGQWNSRAPARGGADYCRADILKYLHRIALDETRWRLYFARNQIVPVHLTYESIVEAPQRAVDKVAALMGISPAVMAHDKITNKIQRDPQTEEWRARFVSESFDASRLDNLMSPGFMRRSASGMRLRLRELLSGSRP